MARAYTQEEKYVAKGIMFAWTKEVLVAGFVLVGFLTAYILPFPAMTKLIIIAVFSVIGALFALVDGPRIIKDLLQFRQRLSNVSYFDPRMQKFMETSTISDSTAFMKDGRMLAFLKIDPIDLEILSSEEQERQIEMFKRFLYSLDTDIQIESKSVPVNLDTWLYNCERSIKARKDQYADSRLKRFYKIKEWINRVIEGSTIRNRVFYVIVPYIPTSKGTGAKQFFIGMFYDFMGKPQPKQKTASIKDINESLKQLGDRVDTYAEILSNMGLGVKRLDDNDIISLFSGYFNDIEALNKEYITPVMWHKSDII